MFKKNYEEGGDKIKYESYLQFGKSLLWKSD